MYFYVPTYFTMSMIFRKLAIVGLFSYRLGLTRMAYVYIDIYNIGTYQKMECVFTPFIIPFTTIMKIKRTQVFMKIIHAPDSFKR